VKISTSTPLRQLGQFARKAVAHEDHATVIEASDGTARRGPFETNWAGELVTLVVTHPCSLLRHELRHFCRSRRGDRTTSSECAPGKINEVGRAFARRGRFEFRLLDQRAHVDTEVAGLFDSTGEQSESWT